MDKISDIRRELRDSLELHAIKQDILLVCLINLLCLACFAVFSRGLRDGSFWIAALLVSALTSMPVLIYSLCIVIKIFRQADDYIFSQCKLCQPYHCKWSRGAMYFTVVFQDPRDGGKFILNTRPIFASYGIAGPLLEEYINKTVIIAYNPETDTVVVIG